MKLRFRSITFILQMTITMVISAQVNRIKAEAEMNNCSTVIGLCTELLEGSVMTIQVAQKNVYGKILIYPVCEIANKFASLLGVKTFNHQQLAGIEALGYCIECQKLPV